jgi:hypothetical protein
MRARSFLFVFSGLFLSVASFVACSSSSTGATAGGACGGLKVYTAPDDPASCQPALDQNCCDQQKACAGNADCVNIVACLNACPKPRQDACVNACLPTDPNNIAAGYADGVQICSVLHTPSGCGWPQGGN